VAAACDTECVADFGDALLLVCSEDEH
jgi:hypothetical protein